MDYYYTALSSGTVSPINVISVGGREYITDIKCHQSIHTHTRIYPIHIYTGSQNSFVTNFSRVYILFIYHHPPRRSSCAPPPLRDCRSAFPDRCGTTCVRVRGRERGMHFRTKLDRLLCASQSQVSWCLAGLRMRARARVFRESSRRSGMELNGWFDVKITAIQFEKYC